MPPLHKTIVKARALRRTLTPPEIKLWQYLRTRPNGQRFRRQHPIGSYVLDFYCPSAKLAIEIDGTAHDMGDNPARDAKRDTWLATQGVTALRIAAQDVMTDLDTVVRHILHHSAISPPPSSTVPLPICDGEE